MGRTVTMIFFTSLFTGLLAQLCENPARSLLHNAVTGCADNHFCNFRVGGNLGECVECPSDCETYEHYVVWESFMGCTALCADDCTDNSSCVNPCSFCDNESKTCTLCAGLLSCDDEVQINGEKVKLDAVSKINCEARCSNINCLRPAAETQEGSHPIYTNTFCKNNPGKCCPLGEQLPSAIENDNDCSGTYEFQYAVNSNTYGIYRDGCMLQACNSASPSECKVQVNTQMDGQPCTFPQLIEGEGVREVQGMCQDGKCTWHADVVCPPGTQKTTLHNPTVDCNRESTIGSTNHFSTSDSGRSYFGPGLYNFNQYVETPKVGTEVGGTEVTRKLFVQWQDKEGRCIVGEEPTQSDYDTFQGDDMQATTIKPALQCQITETGAYNLGGTKLTYVKNLEITTTGTDAPSEMSFVTLITSPLLNLQLMPTMFCPQDEQVESPMCKANYGQEYDGQSYCSRPYIYCQEFTTTHGDPIVWTFDNECYDLNKDGVYLASEAYMFDHKINIAVYNDYMREIQVINRKNGELMLSLNNLGEVVNNNYPYYFSEEVKDCPTDMPNECVNTYTEFEFDAQDFRYFVHILRHNYADPALKEGDLGLHLDIFPKPYSRNWDKHKKHYTGLYFENPLPEELEFCPGGSPRNHYN